MSGRPFHAGMGIMTVRLLLHLHKAVRSLQSFPGSMTFMSNRTGPITFKVAHSAESETADPAEEEDLVEAPFARESSSILEVPVSRSPDFASTTHSAIEVHALAVAANVV